MRSTAGVTINAKLPCRAVIRALTGVIRKSWGPNDHGALLITDRFSHDQVNCMMQCSATLTCGHRCMGTYPVPSLAYTDTDQITELCCDDCVCQKCNRRVDGQRSILKAPKATVASRAPPPNSHGLLLDSGFQTPADPPPQSQSPDKWQAYINDGAKEDDARMLQKRKEVRTPTAFILADADCVKEDAAWEEQRRNNTPRPSADAADAGPSRLIETSPQKPAPSVSGNTSLLVHLDINSTYGAYPQHSSRVSYASAAESRKTSYGGSQLSLLD